MYSAHGPPLPVGQQLRRILQLEVLLAVPSLRRTRRIPRADPNSLVIILVLRDELCDYEVHLFLHSRKCFYIPCDPIRSLRHNHVLRSNVMHPVQHVDDRQPPEGEASKGRGGKRSEGVREDGLAKC